MENTQVGPFLIVRKLGTNRRQQVFHARQTEQNRDVALKFVTIPPDFDRVVALDKINREARILKNLNHPNLVKVFGAGVDEDRIFFATELVEGESLSSLLARRGTLAWDLVVDIARQVASALQYLHDNEIIHSKLTPDKILINRKGQVKVGDLRLNRNKRRRWDAVRRKELEIAAYSAPEQFTEAGATTKSDFYALGVILFECLTGKLPHEPETLGKLVKQKQEVPVPSVSSLSMNCPIWLDKIVSQLLQADPKLRPHTAKAIELGMEQVRQIDSSLKSAVEEVGGGFNVLNAGVDKTEAHRLLGRKVEEEEKPPFYQTAWFLVVCLLVCVAIIIFFMLPESIERRMARAENLMQTDNWEDARSDLIYLKDQESNTEIAEQAEVLYFELKQKSLRKYIDKLPPGNDPERRDFYRANQARKEGRLDDAVAIYEQLIMRCEADGDKRHIRAESKTQLDSLQQLLPKFKIEQSIERAENASKDGEIQEAIKLYELVIEQCGDDTKFQDFSIMAHERVARLKQSTTNGQDNAGSNGSSGEQDDN